MRSHITSISEFISIDRLTAYYELTKPGITFTVLASMLMGFLMASVEGLQYITLFHASVGTYLIAAGTAAHNQFIERKLDRLMNRTNSRPLPENRISAREGFIFSLALILGGLAYLLLLVNWVAGMVSLATTALYLGIYTPMKRIHFTNMIIGAIPGALPPVGGWAAAGGSLLDSGVWILFGIVFLWQVPHVLAIAWLCKDDYNNAGFHMLPRNDQKGYKTATIVMLFLLLLLPVIYALYLLDYGGMIYLAGGMLSSLAYLFYGLRFTLERSKSNAKGLMFASFFYLPVVWIMILVDWLV